MDYVNLGRTGIKVSRLCLGTMTYGSPNWRPWVLNEEQSRPFYKEAIELGINFFDTADIYSLGLSEEILGRALKHFAVKREHAVIATKVYGPMGKDPNAGGLSKKHVRHAIDASLRRLGTDYVDLYQIHRFDTELPAEEVMEALDDVVREGKALHIGASSMTAWQFMKCLAISEREGLSRFVTMQPHYNLIYREEEREMLPLCRAEGIGVIPWSPLARGFLAGNRRSGDFGETSRAKTDDKAQNIYYQPDDFKVVEALGEVAKARGVSNMQAALAWLLGQPGVTAPIIGVSKPGQLKDLAGALSITLSAEEQERLTSPYRPHPVAW